jgi:hypothetical protein
MALASLAALGIGFLKDLAFDHGETLVKKGIKKVTGIDLDKKSPTPEEIEKIKANELEIKKLDFKQLELEFLREKEDNRHIETIRGQSHESYRTNGQQADKIANLVIKWNLPIIAILVLVNILIVYYMQDNATLIAIVSQVIGIAIGKLFSERQAIIDFFFGSSMGSKEKDISIKQLGGK